MIEAEACPDYIHMLLSIPPKLSVSQAVGYMYKYGNRTFWARGYYVDAIESNSAVYPESIKREPVSRSAKHQGIR